MFIVLAMLATTILVVDTAVSVYRSRHGKLVSVMSDRKLKAKLDGENVFSIEIKDLIRYVKEVGPDIVGCNIHNPSYPSMCPASAWSKHQFLKFLTESDVEASVVTGQVKIENLGKALAVRTKDRRLLFMFDIDITPEDLTLIDLV